MEQQLSPNNLHRCNRCPYFTTSDLSMIIHLNRHNSKQDLFNCENAKLEEFSCEKCSFKTLFVKCIFEHSGNSNCGYNQVTRPEIKWHQCQYCEYRSRLKPNLEFHVKLKHSGNIKSRLYHCNQCPFKDKSRGGVNIHKFHEHGVEQPNKTKSTKKRKNYSVKWFYCKRCDYKNESGANLNIHVAQNHVSHPKSQWYQCAQCDFKTKVLPQLRQHNVQHHEDNWQRCQHCQFKTKTPERLKQHLDNTHTKKWYQCQQCDYKSLQVRYLKKHIDSKHEYRNLKCEFCDFKCKHVNVLKFHLVKEHSLDVDLEWFECGQCDYRSLYQGVLYNHVREKHPVREYGKLTCEFCDFACKHVNALKLHLVKGHSLDVDLEWFECGQCDYRSLYEGVLHNHVREKHDPNMKWFWCGYCNAKFRQDVDLKKHVEVRHGSDLNFDL